MQNKPTWTYKGNPIYNSDNLTDMEKTLWDSVQENKIRSTDGALYYKKVGDIFYITRFDGGELTQRKRKKRKPKDDNTNRLSKQ